MGPIMAAPGYDANDAKLEMDCEAISIMFDLAEIFGI